MNGPAPHADSQTDKTFDGKWVWKDDTGRLWMRTRYKETMMEQVINQSAEQNPDQTPSFLTGDDNPDGTIVFEHTRGH